MSKQTSFFSFSKIKYSCTHANLIMIVDYFFFFLHDTKNYLIQKEKKIILPSKICVYTRNFPTLHAHTHYFVILHREERKKL
jgi:hypothetical protein